MIEAKLRSNEKRRVEERRKKKRRKSMYQLEYIATADQNIHLLLFLFNYQFLQGEITTISFISWISVSSQVLPKLKIADGPKPCFLHSMPMDKRAKASDFTGYSGILKKETDRVVWVVPNISALAPGDGDRSGYLYFDSQTTVHRTGCLMVLQNSEIFVSMAKS